MGRRVRLISLPFSALFGHRGMTHSLVAVGMVAGLLGLVTHSGVLAGVSWIVAPLSVGYLSHLLGDAFTPGGVPLFWPKPKTYSLNWFKTGSFWETGMVGLLVLLLLTFGGVGTTILGQTARVVRLAIQGI